MLNNTKVNKIKWAAYELSLPGIDVSFGIRRENGHRTFSRPALVIDINSPIEITKNTMWTALRLIKENMQKILETGMETYFELIPE